MKTLQALFSNFFGTNRNDSISGDAGQVLIKFYSQPDVLQQKMREKKIDTWRNDYCYFIAGSIAKRIWKIGLVFLSHGND